jgi:hypothetical protein
MKYFFIPFIVVTQLFISPVQAAPKELADEFLGTDSQPKECQMSEIKKPGPYKILANCNSFSSVDYPKENYRTFSFVFPDRTVVFYASRLHLPSPKLDSSRQQVYEVNKITLNGKELKLPTDQRPIRRGTACVAIIQDGMKAVGCQTGEKISLSYQHQ